MPAWMAGIQVCRMRPETSMSAWIPALHAGMTETRSRTKTDQRNISRKDAKHVLSDVEGAAKKIVIRTWRSSRLGGRNLRV